MWESFNWEGETHAEQGSVIHEPESQSDEKGRNQPSRSFSSVSASWLGMQWDQPPHASTMMDSTFNLQTKTTFCSVRRCQVCCYSNEQFNQYNTQIEIKSDESTPKGHEPVARGNWHFQQTWKVYLFAKRSDVQIDTYINSRFFSPPNEVSLIVVHWYNFIWNQFGHICWVLECSYPFSK